MTERIFLKLILTLFGLLAVTAFSVEYLVTRVTTASLREDLHQGLVEKAQLAQEALRDLPESEHRAAVETIAAGAKARVTVIRPNGSVVADSEADPADMENHGARPEFVAALQGRTGSATRVSSTIGIELLYVAIPSQNGAVRLALPLSEIDARTREIRSDILRVTILATIPTIFLAAWLARRFSGRLSQIIGFSKQLAEGNFQAPAPQVTGGEIGELGRTLSSTAGQLRSMFEQLQDERSRFAATVNGIGEGILAADRKRRVILFNPAMERMFPQQKLQVGAPLDDWSDRHIPELFDRVFEDGKPCSVDLTEQQPDERAWRVSCAPIVSRKGKVQAVVAVFYDITELEVVDRRRKDFVINVSHELRTPLASIQGYAETLLNGAVDEPDVNRRFVRILAQNAERLAQLTSDLMTLSQIEVNAREFTFSPYSVRTLLDETADSIRTLTERKGIRLLVDPVPDTLQVPCDLGAVHQILGNLLDNAAKYTPEGGTIKVGAREAGPEVEFYVEDTGIGIASEHIPRLFERFYRVDKARSRALGGTGLGLAIVKHLVTAHQGSVHVESELGRGSTFYFRIPTDVLKPAAPVDTRQGVLF